MSRRDDYDDDRDDRGRGRRDRDDYDDYDRGPRTRRAKSGLTTALGIVHIVFGSIAVLLGLCALIGSAGATADARGAGAATGGFLAIMMSILILLAGGGGITAGIGTITRAFWGWILGLVAGGLAGAVSILYLIAMIQAFGIPSFVPGKGLVIVILLVSFLITAGYAAFIFLASFNSKVRADFQQ